MIEELTDSLSPEPKPTHSSRHLMWFISGFILIFTSMLILKKQLSWHSSGQALVQLPLWQFYIVEFWRALKSSGEFGPTSGSGSTALVIFIGHLVFSGICGLISFGIGAIVSRFRK